VRLIEDALAGDSALANAEAATVDGLIARFATEQGASALVKGLRSGLDLDAEAPMAAMNRHLTGIETVFLQADPALAHVASSLIKDVARCGGNISDLVPEGVADALTALYQEEQ
jgi:pantetheine-phosphate adenylyltransferase